MDKDVLVAAGHAIVKALDGGPMEPALAMWVHVSDLDVWKLWLAPRDPKPDKMRFYRIVAEAVSEHRSELHGVEISSIVLVPRSDPALLGMARFMRIPGLGSAYLSNNRFNDLYIQDGIALRVDL